MPKLPTAPANFQIVDPASALSIMKDFDSWLASSLAQNLIQQTTNAPKYSKSKTSSSYLSGALYPSTKTLTTEELLEMTQAVIDSLEKHGWVKGTYHDGEKACLVGAAYNVAAATETATLRETSELQNAWCREVHAFLKELDPSISDIQSWNDKHNRTFDQVIDMLRDFMWKLKSK